jgi:hypothetical protein
MPLAPSLPSPITIAGSSPSDAGSNAPACTHSWASPHRYCVGCTEGSSLSSAGSARPCTDGHQIQALCHQIQLTHGRCLHLLPMRQLHHLHQQDCCCSCRSHAGRWRQTRALPGHAPVTAGAPCACHWTDTPFACRHARPGRCGAGVPSAHWRALVALIHVAF